MKQASSCYKTKCVNWIVLKNFSEALQQNCSSRFGSLHQKSLEPLMLTMKRSDDSTHPYCRSPTPTLNGCDVTLPTRTQTSEQEYSDLAASDRQLSTAYSCNTPQSLFTRNPIVCFLEVDKACEDIFSILPWFFKILVESEMWSILL